MQNSSLGIIFSIGAAFFWSVSVILFRKSGENISPLSLNLFKCFIAFFLLVPTVLVMKIDLFPNQPLSDWWLLIGSGLIGTALADSLFFASLHRIGASLSAIVSCFYLPSIIFLSYFFLNETLGVNGIIGGLLVLSALFVSSLHGKTHDIDKKDLVIGIVYGLGGVLSIAIGIIMIKEILVRIDLIWVTFVRVVAALVGMILVVLLHSRRYQLIQELKFSSAWKWAVPASISGNYLALLCWLGGMKYTLVSLAAILNQLSTVMIFIFAAIFLKEKITVIKTIAIILAISGAVVAIR